MTNVALSIYVLPYYRTLVYYLFANAMLTPGTNPSLGAGVLRFVSEKAGASLHICKHPRNHYTWREQHAHIPVTLDNST